MTQRLHTRLGALTAAAVLVFSLTACSGGDEVEEFCNSGEDAFADLDASGADASDPEAFAQTVSDLHDGFAKVDAPDEISDDWGVFEDTFADLDDKLDGIDTSDTEEFTEVLTEFGETASSDEFTEASTNITDFISENCES